MNFKFLAYEVKLEARYTKLEEIETELAQVGQTMLTLKEEIQKHLKSKEIAKEQENEDETCIYHYYVSRDKVELNEKIELYQGKVKKYVFLLKNHIFKRKIS